MHEKNASAYAEASGARSFQSGDRKETGVPLSGPP